MIYAVWELALFWSQSTEALFYLQGQTTLPTPAEFATLKEADLHVNDRS
jgi:hypothetical protein